MEVLIGIAASLLGVAVGGLLQHFTSQRALARQHKWERSRLVHEKLELIAQTASNLGRELSRFYIGAITAVESGERYRGQVNSSYAQLELLINFYAPELKPHYKNLVSLRDNMSDIVADLISGRIPSEKRKKQDLNSKLFRAGSQAEKICEQLIASASRLGREHLELSTVEHDVAEDRTERL